MVVMARPTRWGGVLGIVLMGCPTSPPTVATAPPDAAEPVAEREVVAQEASEPSASEVVPIEADRFAFVAMEDGPFPNAAPLRTTRVVVSIESPEGEAAEDAERLLSDSRGVERHDEPGAIGLATTPRVWMFGKAGPCEAKVGKAYVAAYDDPYLTLERGFEIESCAEDFAPLAYLGDAAPPLSWRVPTTVYYDTVADPTEWEHATKPVLMANGLAEWEPDAPPAEISVRVHEAGKVWEIGYAHLWPHEEACEEEEGVDLRIGLWDGKRFDELSPVSRFAGNSELIGVLELDGDAAAVIADERYQLQLGLLDGPTIAWSEVRTGDYHDEDVAYWGWSVLEGYCGP